jgi:hypothetical protein
MRAGVNTQCNRCIIKIDAVHSVRYRNASPAWSWIFAEISMSDTPAPAISLPDGAADPELIARDALVCAAWALVAAVRSSRLLAPEADALEITNAALAKLNASWRVVALH